MKFVQRVLNQMIVPILEKRGFQVKGGRFVFPEAAEQLEVSEIVQLSEIIEIPSSYLHDKYSIPMPKDSEPVAKRSSQPAIQQKTEKSDDEPNEKPEQEEKENPKKKKKNLFHRFFVHAPTKERGYKRNFATKLTDSITGKITLADKYAIDIKKLLQEALDEVYKNGKSGKEQPIVSEPLFKISNDALQQGINSVFSEPEFGKKNEEFINEFRHNTAVFAAFKNHRQTEEIVALLYDEDGNLRSFREFKKLALKVSKNYNETWLQTEYNTAVRAARSAVNYRKALETKSIYPNLEYIESTASVQRETHLEYVGTILPIEHPWWDTHMPPSDWNCACSVRPTNKDATEVPQGDYVNPVFQNNPGKTAEPVNLKEHPYVKGVCPYFNTCKRRNYGSQLKLDLVDKENPPIIPECGICELAKKHWDDGFIEIKKHKSGGKVLLHPLVDKKKPDHKDILTIANEFAKQGEVVKITPTVHHKSEEYKRIYAKLIGTKYERKCPDMDVSGVFYEYEGYYPPWKKIKLKNMLSHGLKQSSKIVIKNNKGCSDRFIRKLIFDRLKVGAKIDEVWVYEKGKLRQVF